jgi:LacI family transcriptional regulator
VYRIKRATIKQVAAEAGVSIQTVSRVINSRPDVAAETRERVQQVIERLAYQPSEIARSLIGRRTHTIGVVGSGLEYFGPSSTLAGIEREAAETGWSVLLVLLHEPDSEDVEPVLSDMLARQVEGIIWAVPEIAGNHRWIRSLEPPIVPIVFLTMAPTENLSIVAVDNRLGGRLATEHLLANSHRSPEGSPHIGLVTGPLTWWEARERRLGWQDALLQAGLGAEERQVVEGDWSAASGEYAFEKLREQFPEVDGVFASNDQMAQGVLHAAWTSNLRVPDDLAVVGFDDIPEASYFIPPLTTVRQQSAVLGSSAVRALKRLIDDGHQVDHVAMAQPIILEPKLVVRKSSTVLRHPTLDGVTALKKTVRSDGV